MKQQRSKKLLALVMALVLTLSAFIGVWAEEGLTEISVTEEIVMPEPAAEQPAEVPAPVEETQLEQPAEAPAPAEETQPEQPVENAIPAEETPVEGTPEGEAPVEEIPVEEVPAEAPVEEAPVEEAPALKKGLALVVKKADVTQKAESHKAAYVLSKDALVLAEELEGNTERVKVQFLLNGEKITGYVDVGAVFFIDGEPDGKYAALAVGGLYEMADYAVEVAEVPIAEETVIEEIVEEPVIEETVEEPSGEGSEGSVAEEATEGPVTEEIAEEPVMEVTTEEPVVEEVIEEPLVEEPVEEPTVEDPAVEETIEEPVIEEAIDEPASEETIEEPAVEEVKVESMTEPTPEAPLAPVVTPTPTPAEEPLPKDILIPEETVSADEAGIQEYVERCYTVILGRQGEKAGIDNWVEQLVSGAMGGAAVVRGFVASQEFIAKNYSPKQVVTILYNAMLGRDPDAAGLNDWIEHMEVGMTSDAIVAGFTGSQEFGNICDRYGILPGNFTPTEWRDRSYGVTAFVYRAYKLILNRAAESAGQNNWCAELLSGRMGGADIVMQFLGSQEFLNRNMGAGELVDILYNTMLGRPADAAGKADWIGRLQNKQDVSAIVNGFSGSQEFMGICDQYGINPGTIDVAAAPHVHAWDDGVSVSGGTLYTCYICGALREDEEPYDTDSVVLLKDYIDQYGATDGDGNKYISGDRYTRYSWTIVYNKSTDILEFGYKVWDNISTETITMALKGPVLYPEYAYDRFRGGAYTVKGTGTVNRAAYSMDTRDTIAFFLESTSDEGKDIDDARAFFWDAMCQWDSFIQETAELSMRDLGFTSLVID